MFSLGIAMLPCSSDDGDRKNSKQAWRECFAGCLTSIQRTNASTNVVQQETFEEIVAFLQKVPLLVNDFPRDDIPRLALALTTTGTCYYKPGAEIARQGAYPRPDAAFFFFYAGEGLVLWNGAPSPRGHCIEEKRGVLSKFDYFGGRSLVENIAYTVSIVAGPNGATVLTLSRKQFEEFALHRLKFALRRITAKRHYDPTGGDNIGVREDMLAMDEEFVERHLGKNSNLRNLFSDDMFQKLAKKARRLRIPHSTILFEAGDASDDLYVIKKGNVELEPEKMSREPTTLKGIKRRLRKQAFLMAMVNGASRDQPAWSRQCSWEEIEEQARSLTPEKSTMSTGSYVGVELAHKARSDSVLMPARESIEECLSPRTPGTRRDGTRSRSVCGRDVARFRVNDCVTVMGVDKEVGRVIEILPNEQVVVDFPLKGSFTYKPTHLRYTKNTSSTIYLGPGEIFEEVSFLYKMPRMAICKVSAGEDLIVYSISRDDMQSCLEGEDAKNRDKIAEWMDLLSEVRILTSLVQAERLELARHIVGELRFQPNERIIQKDKVRQLRQWYVIAGGTAVVSDDEETVAVLHRGGHFGDRSLLYNEGISDVNVDAGDRGMVCLCLNGDVVKRLKLIFDSMGFDGTIEDYRRLKSKTTKRETTYEVDPRNLDYLNVLGTGSFATVTLMKDRTTGIQYALKRISKRRVRQQGCQKLICNERDIMSLVDNKFIIKLYLAYQDRSFVYLIQEVALGCTLEIATDRYHAVKSCSGTPEHRAWLACVQYYAGCITLGLKHLHERHIAHRDLKPGNVLLDATGCPKIIDMGFARFVLNKTYTVLGTPEYMAPEIIDLPNAHNEMVDYWALGVLIFELCSGSVPWDDERVSGHRMAYRMRLLQKAEPNPSLPYDIPAVTANFVQRLLTPDPSRRMGAGGFDEIKEHAWFRENFFDFEGLDPQNSSMPARDPPQCPVPIHREVDDEFAEEDPGSFEPDEVFISIGDEQWSSHSIRIEGGCMITDRSRASLEASAMCQSAQVVRLRIDWRPKTCQGPVHVGMTSNPNDTMDFNDGYCLSLVPTLTEPRILDHSYAVPSMVTDSQPMTLSIENNVAVIYQAGKEVHKIIKSHCEPNVKMYPKVFMSGADDRVAVSAYEEYPDDESDWTSAFKKLDAVRRWSTQCLSPSCSPKSPPNSARRRSKCQSVPPNPVDHVMKDISSFLDFLASVEQREGRVGLKLAIQAAQSSAEQRLSTPVPLLNIGDPAPDILDAALADFKSKHPPRVVIRSFARNLSRDAQANEASPERRSSSTIKKPNSEPDEDYEDSTSLDRTTQPVVRMASTSDESVTPSDPVATASEPEPPPSTAPSRSRSLEESDRLKRSPCQSGCSSPREETLDIFEKMQALEAPAHTPPRMVQASTRWAVMSSPGGGISNEECSNCPASSEDSGKISIDERFEMVIERLQRRIENTAETIRSCVVCECDSIISSSGEQLHEIEGLQGRLCASMENLENTILASHTQGNSGISDEHALVSHGNFDRNHYQNRMCGTSSLPNDALPRRSDNHRRTRFASI